MSLADPARPVPWRLGARSQPGAPGTAARQGRVAGVGGAVRFVARHVAVVVAYSLPAVLLWWHAWDGHLTSSLACACGDTGQQVWFVAWPAYALAHGLDPFFSSAVQVPHGVNLLSNAAAVPVGLALAPVTWAAGPVAATNVALTLCPGLSAWGCWVACRRLTSWGPAAVASGALFGYSPFVVTNLATGHVSLCLLAVPPLLLVATWEILYGRADRRALWGVALGVLVALQFLLSAEILAITAVVGVPTTVAAVLARPRARLGSPTELVRALGIGAAVTVFLLAGPLWLALYGPQHIVGPPWPDTVVAGNPVSTLWDAGGYRAPGDSFVRLGGYLGATGPPPAYLGPVVLALAGLSLAVAWRRRAAWVLAGAAVLCVVLSWGALLVLTPGHVSGVWLPWQVLGTRPVLADVIPQRFSALGDLLIALLVGVGIDRWRRAWPATSPFAAVGTLGAVAAAVAVVSLWWTYQVPLRSTPVSMPRWYATAALELPRGSVVLAYPFPFPSAGTSEPMVWQAMDSMRFRLAGGYVKAPGPGGQPLSDDPGRPPYGILAALSTKAGGPVPADTPAAIAALRAALSAWHVSYVVATGGGRAPQLARSMLTAAVGAPPLRQDGAWVWRVRRDP